MLNDGPEFGSLAWIDAARKSWKKFECHDSNHFTRDNIAIYKLDDSLYSAYVINRDIIGSNEIIYNGAYEKLKNSPGIYFLYSVGSSNGRKDDRLKIYIGRTSRKTSVGIERLVEHAKATVDNEFYADDWNKALYIVKDTDRGFSLDLLADLEAAFIRIFKRLSISTNYNGSGYVIECLNSKSGDFGNSDYADFKRPFDAIRELLFNSSIDIVTPELTGMYLTETLSIPGDVFRSDILNLYNKVKQELEEYKHTEESNATDVSYNSIDIIKVVQEAKKNYLRSFEEYKKNRGVTGENDTRVYTQADIYYDRRSQAVLTNGSVVKEMVELIPDSEITSKTKFLCLYSKDAAFANGLIKKIVFDLSSKSPLFKEIPNQKERLRHFVIEQLYIVAPNSTCYNNSMFCVISGIEQRFKYAYRSGSQPLDVDWRDNIENCVKPHAIDIPNMETLVKTDGGIERIIKYIREEFGTDMKFDVVVGNPPYNNDLYTYFMVLSQKLSDKYTCMITPAKWSRKSGYHNERVRKEVEPYMSKIVFYPNARELFDIAEIDGVAYYLADKEKHDIKEIVNKSSNAVLNNVAFRKVDGILNNSVISIIYKLRGCEKIHVDTTVNPFRITGHTGNDVGIYTNGKIGEWCSEFDIKYRNDIVNKYKVVANQMLGYSFFFYDGKILGSPLYVVLNPGVICSANYCVFRAFDTKEEAESMISFLNTKFIRFVTSLTLTGASCGKDEFWTFVPDPGPLDHIFTDAELYQRFNLSEDEIHVIESVIKNR